MSVCKCAYMTLHRLLVHKSFVLRRWGVWGIMFQYNWCAFNRAGATHRHTHFWKSVKLQLKAATWRHSQCCTRLFGAFAAPWRHSFGIHSVRICKYSSAGPTLHTLKKIFGCGKPIFHAPLCCGINFHYVKTPTPPADSFSNHQKHKPKLIYPLSGDSCDLIHAYLLSFTCHSVRCYNAATPRQPCGILAQTKSLNFVHKWFLAIGV